MVNMWTTPLEEKFPEQERISPCIEIEAKKDD
jgi:hypothetical protein